MLRSKIDTVFPHMLAVLVVMGSLVLGYTGHAATINVPADYTTIQAAITAAVADDIIIVAAGTYQEQLYIDKSLDISGAGIGLSIIEAPDAVSRTTYNVTLWNTDDNTIDAIVGVNAAGTVSISGFTIDGRDTGPADFYGVHFFDTDCSLTNCQIEDVLDPATPGGDTVASVVATHSLSTTVTADISNNIVPNFQKCGITVMGPDVTFTVNENQITNAASTYLAGNGIQLSFGASGSTDQNVIDGIATEGDSWDATGILLFESGDVALVGDEISNCDNGLNFSDWGSVFVNPATVTISATGLNLHDNDTALVAQLSDDDSDLDLTITDCTIIDCTDDGINVFGTDENIGFYSGWDNGDLSVTITGCVIGNTVGVDGLWTADQSTGTNVSSFTVNDNAFFGNTGNAVNHNITEEMDATDCWWNDVTGPTPVAKGGSFVDGVSLVSPYGMKLPERGFTFTKEISSENKAGENVSGNVNYTPFRSGNVVCQPDAAVITLEDDIGGGVYEKEVVVSYLGGGSDDLWGYSIAFTWDPALVSVAVVKPDAGAFANLANNGFFFPTINNTTGSASIDCAIGAALPGTPVDDLFKITFTVIGVPPYDTTPITFGTCVYRDINNQDLTGIVADDGSLIIDLGIPIITALTITNNTLAHTDDYLKNSDDITITADISDSDPAFDETNIVADLTGFGGAVDANPDTYVGTTATWNVGLVAATTPADGLITVEITATDAQTNSTNDNDTITADNTPPTALTGLVAATGHKKVDLTWDDPTGNDTNFYGVEFRYAVWSDYPEYTIAAPTYPADETEGTQALTSTGTAETHSFATDDRDIYYYAGFIYDQVLHYSPTDGAYGNEARATNYWLGDVSDGTYGQYDGYDDVSDVTSLGSCYGLSTGDGSFRDECDVGPTDNSSRVGVPEPDGLVKFEDLMIFAMNYTIVAPAKENTDLCAPILVWRQVSDLDWMLEVTTPESDLKGVCLTADLPAGVTVEVRGGKMYQNQDGLVFLQNVADDVLDTGIAIFGTESGFVGCGELCRVTTSASVDLSQVTIQARGLDNTEYLFETNQAEIAVPQRYELAQNYPNPFNPITNIQFSLPAAETVKLDIYSIDGRLVKTLLNIQLDAGYHETLWDGRNGRGEMVASGAYFYKLVTESFTDVRKMILTK